MVLLDPEVCGMQPSNCLLCGEVDDGEDNLSTFEIGEDITFDHARKLCKLLKLPYQDNATVLKGLRGCNFCVNCKSNIVKFDSFLVQLESLKSRVDTVRDGFMTKLQPAQLESFVICTGDETANKTAEVRQYLRNCLGIVRTEGEQVEPESTEIYEPQDDDDEDAGFSLKIVDVRGGAHNDGSQELQVHQGDDGVVVKQNDLRENEARPRLQEQDAEDPDPPPPYVPKTSLSLSYQYPENFCAGKNTESGYGGSDAAEDTTELDVEYECLIPPDLDLDEEGNEKSFEEDPLRIFDENYDEESRLQAQRHEEPEVSRGGMEVPFHLASEWLQHQNAGVHFLVQDPQSVVRRWSGQSILKPNLHESGVVTAPKPRTLNWNDLRESIPPSCYRICEEPDGKKKLKLTGKMSFEEIRLRVEEYRNRREQLMLEANYYQGLSESGSDSYDSAQNSPADAQSKKRKPRGEPHQTNERKRRAELAERFEDLRRLVPNLNGRVHGGLKYSKVSILVGATEYCSALRNSHHNYVREKSKLETRVNELKRKLGLLGAPRNTSTATTATAKFQPPFLQQ